MEWLMGKARGVGKTLINSGSNQNSANNHSNSQQDSTDKKEYPRFSQQKFLHQQIPNHFPGESLDLQDLLEPPPHMDINEWLAYHTISFFENISTFFDTLFELCVCSNLKHVNSSTLGPLLDNTFLHTFDSFISHQLTGCHPQVQIPANSAARHALDLVLNSCHEMIESPKVFPVRYKEVFPADLQNKVSELCHKLVLCLAHLYLAHFLDIEALQLVPHINTLFKHFYLFTRRFNLLEDRDFEPFGNFPRDLVATPAPAVADPKLSKNSSFSSGNPLYARSSSTANDTTIGEDLTELVLTTSSDVDSSSAQENS